jgi:hypothetical protein
MLNLIPRSPRQFAAALIEGLRVLNILNRPA